MVLRGTDENDWHMGGGEQRWRRAIELRSEDDLIGREVPDGATGLQKVWIEKLNMNRLNVPVMWTDDATVPAGLR